jgi:hypothetical protein
MTFLEGRDSETDDISHVCFDCFEHVPREIRLKQMYM